MLTLQAEGQQPSPPLHCVMAEKVHVAEQAAAVPERVSEVQVSPSSQVVGQLDGGSQVSPTSLVPLPQVAEQSLSLLLVQLAGQHPSPPRH